MVSFLQNKNCLKETSSRPPVAGARPPRSVFSHPDCTVGTGIAPVQLALADFLLTAGRGSHPALKTFYSVADSQYSTFFVKCNRFLWVFAVVFGERVQARGGGASSTRRRQRTLSRQTDPARQLGRRGVARDGGIPEQASAVCAALRRTNEDTAIPLPLARSAPGAGGFGLVRVDLLSMISWLR